MDLQLNMDSSGGMVELDGIAIPVLRVASVAGKVAGKWVPSTTRLGKALSDDFDQSLNYDTFIGSGILQSLDSASFAGKGFDVLDGTPVQVFSDSDGIACVAASEPHYLMRVKDPAGDNQLDFTGWNQPVPLSAPPVNEIFQGKGI